MTPDQRQTPTPTPQPCRIRCCTVGGCLAANALAVKAQFQTAVTAAGLEDQVTVASVGCLGLCGQAPLVQIDPAGDLYTHVTPAHAAPILATLSHPHPPTLPPSHSATPPPLHPSTLPFFTRQHRIVLENSGLIDPERIEDYLAAQGYEALHRCLRDLEPETVIDTITRSGLRGRGGAGYPTGLKWATVAKMPPGQKYVVCNADEGDPGAYMDRSVLESDPHRVLEGMAIAAYAVGANQGYIYVRGEYPLANRHLQTALGQAKRHGVLGSQIFDSPFDFRVDLRIGAGAFVCGEETALIASIEGKRGLPRPRPPYPAESGLWGCPTLINNVETFANIAPILRNGADWFAAIGTAHSRGTKVFSLTGHVQNAGLIEVPMGITLREIVEAMGQGTPDGTPIKAVQTGGPSGGCIPAEAFDTPVDYESLKALGSIMGSGGMIVMDEHTSMVEVAQFFMEFCMEESCGKCIPCRAGTVQLYQLLTKFKHRRATPGDLAQLEALCDMVQHTSLCGLGQAAPNPVLSTLRYFRDEYLAAVVELC
ncbi:NuoF family protein [Nodosilinea sp. PGN35]|uniref:NuoF family protein n=1 Tax=Nodosilinea sp. PGN35 TaxID=3020489 RepID=UPI0023B2E376|nr:NuoF family protein [Nodosilinea sp. TSF1-S3]MDF0369700.1 NADH-ubiquinone oxidoreductase-F iron-sulfur binding region domain-containing protein [Nodosilinea sp. TSF1-S3]